MSDSERPYGTLQDVILMQAAHIRGTCDHTVDPATSEYVDPAREDLAHLEALLDVLENVRTSGVDAGDLRHLLALRSLYPDSFELERIEKAVRACLELMPSLTPHRVLDIDLEPGMVAFLQARVDRGEAGSLSAALSDILEAAFGALDRGEIQLPAKGVEGESASDD
jgi:hypothetical protein